ncbi:MAG TPA: serine/threonine-protein kinase, partial [Vicinamibacteria bacterium]
MPSLASDERCPDCGTPIVSEPGIPGLCPQCIFSMALRRPEPAPDDAETLDRPAAGRILGERYQVRELLGRGGMGEVFRAFDLKLRVDVALKAARLERAGSERGREMLRREVRSAREVVSPNVCRIFDLVVEEGQELVSMEYIDGDTLAQRLRERGPLAMEEAREIASQFLSGLEAIHQAGFVHRDFKPENVMITRAGRVVVMDFGLAKVPTERSTTISGTPAYMAPEQTRGEGVDTRADVFAAGMVLSEMLGAGGEAYDEVRQELWRALR